jgi:hypothetical protein
MSQPASLTEPRDGEVVLACPHDWEWKSKAVYIGHCDKEGNPTGLGSLVVGGEGFSFYARWVVLCAWCRVWGRLRRQHPLQRARRRMEWVAE